MNKIELLECFQTFTREDFKNLDKVRTDIFAATQEEIEAQKIKEEQEKMNTIQEILKKNNITPPIIFSHEFML
jgi:DNA-binding protein H-NS